jgi:hypothetical protein
MMSTRQRVRQVRLCGYCRKNRAEIFGAVRSPKVLLADEDGKGERTFPEVVLSTHDPVATPPSLETRK